jgi:hypothetical protein
MLVLDAFGFARVQPRRRFARHEFVRGRFGRFVIRRNSGQGARGYSARGRVDIGRRIGGLYVVVRRVGRPLHFTDEGLGRVLNVPDELPGTPGNLGELIGSEQQQGNRSGNGHVGNGEHAEGFFPKLLNGTRPGKYDESFGRPPL